MFYEWNGYKLRLDAKRIEQLEEALGGKSPLSIFAGVEKRELPSLKDMLTVLHFSMLALQSNIKRDDVYDIYDKYVEDGGSMIDLIKVITEVYRSCGIIPKELTEAEVKK